jgi:hypothetical protein
VFSELVSRGARVIFAAEPGKDPVPSLLAGDPDVSSVPLPLKDSAGEAVALFRRICDLNRFLDPELASAEWPRRRTARRALVMAGDPDADETAGLLAGVQLPASVHAGIGEMLAQIERRLPPPPGLLEAVSALDVDAVLLVSRCSLGGVERDVLKIARALGLPSTMLVWSWDNLSSKALLTEHPDHLLVWNDLQVEEAFSLHGLPRERVHALGAPSFDDFFAAAESLPASGPGRSPATILYLGSSQNISPDEPAIFARWLAAVRNSDDARVREARVVVRPYPGGGAWRDWSPPDGENVVAERGRKLDAAGLAAALGPADAVVALNTSGELEAAIAGRPVLTFRADGLAPGQEGSIHFEYLLEANGGFVIDARDLEEHTAHLARVLRGDYDRERLRAFVERFIRPRGLDRPVSPAVAEAILELAGRPARSR